MLENAKVPHVFVAGAEITQTRPKKRVFFEALRAVLIGTVAGYADYRLALTSGHPVFT